jgi:HPt (histidine-containing phosphotransfer) domain-containing protein
MKYEYINLRHLLELSDNDMGFVREIVGDALVIIPESLDSMKNAAEHDDRKEIIFHAHKIKGTLRFIGCTIPADIAENIEHNKDLPIEKVRLLVEEINGYWLKAAAECNELLG